MKNKHTLKTSFSSSLLIIATLAIGGCASPTGDPTLDKFLIEGSWVDIQDDEDTAWNNQEAKEHNQKLLKNEGLEQIGETRYGPVVEKDGQSGAWIRDTKTNQLYPAVQSDDGAWTMSGTGLLQRNLDKEALAEEKKKQEQKAAASAANHPMFSEPLTGGIGAEGGDGGGGD